VATKSRISRAQSVTRPAFVGRPIPPLCASDAPSSGRRSNASTRCSSPSRTTGLLSYCLGLSNVVGRHQLRRLVYIPLFLLSCCGLRFGSRAGVTCLGDNRGERKTRSARIVQPAGHLPCHPKVCSSLAAATCHPVRTFSSPDWTSRSRLFLSSFGPQNRSARLLGPTAPSRPEGRVPERASLVEMAVCGHPRRKNWTSSNMEVQ
jgi:hypothetical protein